MNIQKHDDWRLTGRGLGYVCYHDDMKRSQ